MKNKKGISAIVATVLIILITVAAVTIIWAAIIPMIQENLAGSQECLAASSAMTVKSEYSCVRQNSTCLDGVSATEAACMTASSTWYNSSIDIQVHRSTGDFELRDVEIITGAGGTTSSIKAVADLAKIVPDVNGDQVYTIYYNSADKKTEAAVAAIVATGKTETTCDKSGMAQIPDCA
jgi:flagellin-like protein